MTPNQMEKPAPPSPAKTPGARYRSRLILLVAILIVAGDFIGQYMHGASVARSDRSEPTTVVVPFSGPAGAYHLRYEPALFRYVPDKNQPRVATFVAKNGHAQFTVSSVRDLVAFGSLFEQEEDYYRGMVPSVYITGRVLSNDDFYSIVATTFHVSGNQQYISKAYRNDATDVVNKLRIHYDSDCDSLCVTSLRRMSASFYDSSPH